MTKALLKNLLLLLQFLIYLQSANADDSEGYHNSSSSSSLEQPDNHLTGSSMSQNLTATNCTSSDSCPLFSVCMSNRCQCLYGSQLGNSTLTGNGSSTCLPRYSHFTVSPFNGTVHIESGQVVQTGLLIVLPMVALICLFFFCDRLGKYVQDMQSEEVQAFPDTGSDQRSRSVEGDFSGAGSGVSNGESFCIDIPSLKKNVLVVDLPPTYNVTQQHNCFSHVHYLTSSNILKK